jgi:hypothetical protein
MTEALSKFRPGSVRLCEPSEGRSGTRGRDRDLRGSEASGAGNGGNRERGTVMREATRDDLPKGAEAQCPACWRMFGSNSSADSHKRWAQNGALTCIDPPELGMQARERRGLAIWVVPMRERVVFT